MGLKRKLLLLVLLSIALLYTAGTAFGGQTMVLGVCQELVNMARGYEARAAQHAAIAKSLMVQIENSASRTRSTSTSGTVDNLFEQYDQHRQMEKKLRELYRRVSEEAEKCMKAAE